MKAAVGKLVHTVVNPNTNGGSDVAAAIVTKVTPVEDGNDLVNLTVFVDGSDPLRLTGVEFFETRSDAKSDDSDDEPETTATGELVTTQPIVKYQAFPAPR